MGHSRKETPEELRLDSVLRTVPNMRKVRFESPSGDEFPRVRRKRRRRVRDQVTGLGLRVWDSRSDLFFTDQYGYRNPECISLWADDARTVAGRTPRECYRDFMVSFRDTFENLLQSTISEIAVGCGPCGELRYPSYPENKRSPNSSQWRFPGIGEFQCYDQRALGALASTPPRLDASNGADLVRTIAADTTTYRKKLVSFGPIQGVGTANTVNSFSIGTRKSSLNTATRRYKLREKCLITRKLALT